MSVNSHYFSRTPTDNSLDVGCVVLSVNYRHAPEHVYPAAINDAFAGLSWILSPERMADLMLDPTRIALGGLSA
jgi:acetyl esterase/lipase